MGPLALKVAQPAKKGGFRNKSLVGGGSSPCLVLLGGRTVPDRKVIKELAVEEGPLLGCSGARAKGRDQISLLPRPLSPKVSGAIAFMTSAQSSSEAEEATSRNKDRDGSGDILHM